jgi:hypothetical protein
MLLTATAHLSYSHCRQIGGERKMASWKDVKDELTGGETGETHNALVVHHRDRDASNSDPDNLAVVPASDSSLTPPQAQALEKFKARAPLIIQDARAISVSSPESKQAASLMRQDIRAAMDLLEALKRPEINRAHKMHKDALAELNSLLSPWKTADEILKSSQDAYELRLRRERQETARKIEEEMRRAREEVLRKQMEEAERQEDVMQILEVVERQEAPLPIIPVIHTPVRVEGGSTRTTLTFNLLDISKVRPDFILSCIYAEVVDKGECEWLMKWIGREVKKTGRGAEEVVGKGSIEFEDGVSTGVRRKK